MKKFGVVITCCKADFLFAKGTCASVRFFMPGVPICFLIDGDFELGDLPEGYDITILNKDNLFDPFLKKNSWGWGLTKMNAFWESPFETFLVVDSDTVLYGDMRKFADFDRYDFIIDRPKYEYTLANLDRYFFNPMYIGRYYPELDYAKNPYVCTGVVFGRRGILELDDYKRFFEIKEEQPDFFRLGEQGFLNILLFQLSQQGRIRLGHDDIQFIFPDYSHDESKEAFPIPISDIKGPQVIHWAGSLKPLLRTRNQGYMEPMVFFRKRYLADLGITDEIQQEKILNEEDGKSVREVSRRIWKSRIERNIRRVTSFFKR